MATPADLSSAADAYAVQAQLAAAAVAAAQSVRPQTPTAIAEVVAAFQLIAAQQGAAAVPPMLAEQGIPPATVASVLSSSVAGLTSAGYPLATMFEVGTNLAMLAASAVQDAGRIGASLQMAVTPAVTGYVRMLNPPSCSRCAVLAGRFYRWNEGFERHPNCDCRHIPAAEDSGDLTTDPQAYFDSLTPAEQDRIFTKAGAQAIRDGADVGQVVNARRGMTTTGISRTAIRVVNGEEQVVNVNRRSLAPVQVGGRDVFTTSEGTTRRGLATRARTGRNMSARLMPETLYAVATSREDALRLLKLHGYIT